MKLYIAEKPSMGRAIVEALPKPHRKEPGCVWVGDGDCVSWCIGHLLEPVEPEHYDARYKSWRLADLPLLPDKWQLRAKPKTKSQLSLLKRLIRKADTLVHAGDPDREGQLLVDEAIYYCQGKRIAHVDRLLINDLNPSAIKLALSKQRPNSDFKALSVSALARSRADWLFGINMTRAYTLKGREQKYSGLLSVGRVQTPLLALVVRRDDAIRSFISKPFFEVKALLSTLPILGDHRFHANWQPSQACEPYQDIDGRIILRSLAENVSTRITDQKAEVTQVERKPKRHFSPLPYNLSALQIDAAKAFGFSAQLVLDTCQALYERHKLITYPRSDCHFLPEAQFAQASDVGLSIAHNLAQFVQAVSKCDFTYRSRAWSDTKVEAHHAIIPTMRKMQCSQLTEQQHKIYTLIARQYLYQFYGPYCFEQIRIEVMIQGGLFHAECKSSSCLGWKDLAPKAGDSEEKQLPKLEVGQILHCIEGIIDDKQTTAPKHFTDATLMAAMTGIARYVQAPQLKSVLKESDGLGTEATRAGIIELLFKRQFLMREGKAIKATPSGAGLIEVLPNPVTQPDMTAQWESQLEAMSHQQMSYKAFMLPMEEQLVSLIEHAKQTPLTQLAGLTSAYVRKQTRRRSTSKKRSKS